MSYKILTKNGIENTNIEHARDFNFNSGGKSGIIKGVLNECNIASGASNVVTIDTCELRLCGHRIVIEDAEYLTLSNNPSQAIRYSIIAEIRVADSVPAFKLFYQLANSTLIKDNLSAHVLGNGTYQLELGRFTLNTDGTISDIVRTADLIIGGGYSIESGKFNIGNITTNTLDAGMEAEIDIEERYDAEQDKIYTDFTFSIPKGDEGKQGLQGIQGPQGEKGDKGDKGDTFSGGTVGSLTFDKAGTGFTFITKDNVQYFIYGDGVNYSRLYLQIKDKDGNYQWYPLLDENGKLYSGKNEVATQLDLNNYLPLTAGSEKQLTELLYANLGVRIASGNYVIFQGEARFITPSKVIRFGSSGDNNSDLLVMTASYLRPNGNNTVLGNSSNQWKEIYGKTIYQNGKQVATADYPQMIADGVVRTGAGYTTWVSSDGKSWYIIHPTGYKECGMVSTATINTNGSYDFELPVQFSNADSFVAEVSSRDWQNAPLAVYPYKSGDKSGVVEGQSCRISLSADGGQSCKKWQLYCAGY